MLLGKHRLAIWVVAVLIEHIFQVEIVAVSREVIAVKQIVRLGRLVNKLELVGKCFARFEIAPVGVAFAVERLIDATFNLGL